MSVKRIIKKNLTPDEMYPGDMILWQGSILSTLNLLWHTIETKHYRFYQKSFKFDRWVEGDRDFIREFFDKRGVHAVAMDYDDDWVGKRSWLVLIACRPRYDKYKPWVNV